MHAQSSLRCSIGIKSLAYASFLRVSTPNPDLHFTMKKQPTDERILSTQWAQRRVPDVIKWEVFPVRSGATATVTFESVKSPGQGIWFASDGGIEIDGTLHDEIVIWQRTAPKRITFVVRSSDDLLHFYNVWNDPRAVNHAGSQSFTSGMLREELSSGARYRCNDLGFNKVFDRLVFTIEFGPQQESSSSPTQA